MGGPGSGRKPSGHTKANTNRPRSYGVKSVREGYKRNTTFNKAVPSNASKSTSKSYKKSLTTIKKSGRSFGSTRKVRR